MLLYLPQSGTAGPSLQSFAFSASGPTSLKLSELPARIAQKCTHLELLRKIPSPQLDCIKSLSSLTCLKLCLDRESGSSPIDHARLLKDLACLELLEKLRLTYLAISPGVVTIFSPLSSLRSLHIMSSTDAVVTYDFQTSTQLTSISFSAAWKSPTQLFLPVGDTVSLQKLKIQAVCHMRKLGFATNLKCIGISPESLESSHIEWPPMLPNLQDFTDTDAEYGYPMQHLPHEWVAYTNLTHICLITFTAEDLPGWFSNLQQLRSLDMSFAEFPRLPSCLSRLSGLQTLNLASIDAYLPADIVGLASLPLLTSLDFGDSFLASKKFAAAERLHLQLLELHLLLHKPPLKRYGGADSCYFGEVICNKFDEGIVQQIKCFLSTAHGSLDMQQ